MDRILLITNAEAGSHDERAVDAAADVLRSRAEVHVEATRDAEGLTKALKARDGRDVVVVGGDGSLHAVVDTLRRLGDLDGPTVGLVPLGTGNDFARGAGLSLVPSEAAAVVFDGVRRRVDLLVDDEDGIAVNAVHVGVGAEAAVEAKPWKRRLSKVKLGKVGYAIGALIAGFKTQGERLLVRADEHVLADGKRHVLQVGVANGPTVGGGVPLMPQADPADGFVDVMVSFAVSPLQRFLYGVHLKRGTHAARHDVQVARAARVEISGEGFWCNADGELAGPLRSRSWNVQASAFTMVLPNRPVDGQGLGVT